MKYYSQSWQIVFPLSQSCRDLVVLSYLGVGLEGNTDDGGGVRVVKRVKQRLYVCVKERERRDWERMCLFLREALVTGFWVNESCIVFHQR